MASLLATSLQQLAEKELGRNLTPRESDFLTCIAAALQKTARTLIAGVIACFQEQTPTQPGDYKPGDRNRCA